MNTPPNTNDASSTQPIEKLLFEAYKFQNSEYYDDALENLQAASDQLIKIIESMQKSPEFYMKVMPIMKQERQLVQQQHYKEFWHRNEKVLCRNFEKNTYRALINEELRQRQAREKDRLNALIQDQNNMMSLNASSATKKIKSPSGRKKKAANNNSPPRELETINEARPAEQTQNKRGRKKKSVSAPKTQQ